MILKLKSVIFDNESFVNHLEFGIFLVINIFPKYRLWVSFFKQVI